MADDGWRHRYGSDRMLSYINLEARAATIKQYESLLIPGLLQSKEYAAEVIEKGSSTFDFAQYERELEVRMSRQALLYRKNAPQYQIVLDEAVLRRVVGGPTIMREQLRYLAEIAKLPTVTLQIVEFSVGAHAGMTGPFTLLEFSSPAEPDVLYLEHNTRDFHVINPNDVRGYKLLFAHLQELALKVDSSRELLLK